MKTKAIAALLFGVSFGLPLASNAAGGPIDGIYACKTYTSSGVVDHYVTVNGYPDGRTIYAIPAVSAYTDLYGYGIGQVTGNTFAGQTMFSSPFRLTINGNHVSGSVSVPSDNGRFVDVSTECDKIW
jgi:hypothetical protein